MPYITMKIVEGRDLETKRRLVAAVTEAVCGALPTTPDQVRIELIELKEDLFSVAGELFYDKRRQSVDGE